MRFGMRASLGALLPDVPHHGPRRPNERHRTENEDAVQIPHRGEDNKDRQEGSKEAAETDGGAPFPPAQYRRSPQLK